LDVIYFIGAFFAIFIPMIIIVDPLSTLALFISMTSDRDRREQILTARDAIVYASAFLVLFVIAGKYILEYMGISIFALKVAGGILLAIFGLNMLKEGEHVEAPKAEKIAGERIAAEAKAEPLASGQCSVKSKCDLSSPSTLQSEQLSHFDFVVSEQKTSNLQHPTSDIGKAAHSGGLPTGGKVPRGGDIALVPLAIPLLAGPGAISYCIVAMGDYLNLWYLVILAIAVTMAITFALLINSPRIMKYIGPNGARALTRIMGFLTVALAVDYAMDGLSGWIHSF